MARYEPLGSAGLRFAHPTNLRLVRGHATTSDLTIGSRTDGDQLDRPEWWDWELGWTSHAEARMDERGFSELDVRTMMTDATAIARSRRAGRWLVSSRLAGQPWTLVVEPDPDVKITYVVTAFQRDTDS